MILNDLDSADFTLFGFTAFWLLFTIRFAFWSRPFAHENRSVGIPFLISQVWLSIVLAQISLSVITDAEYPYRDVVRNVVYGSGCVATLVLLVVLVRQQRKDRRR